MSEKQSQPWRILVAREGEHILPSDPPNTLSQGDPIFGQVVEASLQGIAICADGRIVFVNSAAARLFGYDRPAELTGRIWEELVATESREPWRTRVATCLRNQSTSALPPWLGSLKNGAQVWIESTEQLIPWKGEAAMVINLLDVSERARLEQSILHARKLEVVGQLAGGVAHDFNNLLTVINGYSELVLRTLRPEDPSRRLVQGIVEASERAAALTRQLLTFSRKQVLEPRVLDLNVLVRDSVRLLGRLIGENITLRTQLEPDLGRVHADPGQVEQIIMNLMVNARDAMPQGGTLTLTTANAPGGEGESALPDSCDGPFVVLTVGDTGCGMDESVKKRIFEPFFTTKGPGQGTGLGLATVYSIVRNNGGYIQVDSAPGAGARFSIFLPCAGWGDPDSWPPRPTLSKAPRGTETVLLVEDDNAVRFLARHVLQAQGYDILEAVNGEEAIQLAQRRREPIHLLVTDVIMPQMGGHELATWLVQLHPEIRVLFLSGYPEAEAGLLLEFQESQGGYSGFLQKPFTPNHLAAKVRKMLDEQRQRINPSV